MSTRVSKLSDAEFARQMARREIVFQRPTRWWQDGLTIGNGDLGGAVFGGGPETNGMVGITLSKVDVWDERYDRRGAQYRPLAEVRRLIAEHSGTEEGRKFLDTLEPGCIVADKNWVRESYPYAYEPPTPKPSGLVRIDLGAVLEPFEERLSIHRGEVTFTVGDRKKGATISTFVDADSNVLVVQVKRRGGYDRPITLEFARYVDEQLGEPEVSVEGTDFWHRYVFPDGFTYALYGIVAEGEVAKTGTGSGEFRDIEARTGWEIRNGRRGMKIWEVELHLPERKATLTLAPGVSSVTLYVGVATTKETRDPLARARELAQAAAGKGYNAIYAAHRAWWEVFWRKSSLVLSDRMVEALWYQGLYVLACQS
ncbi:MAG: glycoside hydrolase N-terminal domain-containing protein, partial [Anaerolineae bacterium]|nr:glycoside hydrolase N-terminal domain-containing protein [Anaerolineae bacterium]